MTHHLPASYAASQATYPAVYAAYEQLGAAVHNEGPLDEATRALIKLALAVGVGAEGAVHSHTRKCLEAGHSAAGNPYSRFSGGAGGFVMGERYSQ